MTFLIIWIAFGIIGSMIADKKGNSGVAGFLLGILLGPIGLLIAFFTSDNPHGKERKLGNTRKCPYCAEYVKPEAKVCKHCGRNLDGSGFDIEKYRS